VFVIRYQFTNLPILNKQVQASAEYYLTRLLIQFQNST
jgi:hypothetical protein